MAPGLGRIGEVFGQRAVGKPPSELREAAQEGRLQLADERPGDAHEQVVEAAIFEVVLDAGTAHPADASVDDIQLAVVDVA